MVHTRLSGLNGNPLVRLMIHYFNTVLRFSLLIYPLTARVVWALYD